MACVCMTKIDAMLKPHNTRLGATIIFKSPGYATVTLATELVEKKRGARPVTMLPSHCPFCGTRYEEDAVETEAA